MENADITINKANKTAKEFKENVDRIIGVFAKIGKSDSLLIVVAADMYIHLCQANDVPCGTSLQYRNNPIVVNSLMEKSRAIVVVDTKENRKNYMTEVADEC